MGNDRLTATEFRDVMREATLRFERAMRALAAEIRDDVRAQREESRRYFERLDAKTDEHAVASRLYFERLDAKLDETIAEGRAGRQALFHLLDELRGRGGPEPA